MNVKEMCAKQALSMIPNHSIIGLGGGSTIGYLTQYIADTNLDVKIVTPSHKTALNCQKLGLNVVPTWLVDEVEIAFDGCDEVDYQFHALKSGGGIHTNEKIIASMAKRYVLLVDEEKVYPTLGFDHPVVLEVMKEAYSVVEKKVAELGGTWKLRMADNKDGVLISDHGNLLIDVTFDKNVDVQKLSDSLKSIYGIVDTSLVVGLVSDVVVVKDEKVYKLEKGGIYHEL